MSDVIKYEKRGMFDNSQLKDSLVFTMGDKRIAVFKHHDPSWVGVAVTLPSGSIGCFEMSCSEFYDLFEHNYIARRKPATKQDSAIRQGGAL